MINNPTIAPTGGGQSGWNFASFLVSGEKSDAFWFDDGTFNSVYLCQPAIPFPLEFDDGTVVNSDAELNSMTEDDGVMYSTSDSNYYEKLTIGNGVFKNSGPDVFLMRLESSAPPSSITFPNFRVFVWAKFK